jgi:hypothetical protein
MSLPPSFSGMPMREQYRYFRNVCIDFRKAIKSTEDPEVLSEQLDRFIGASRSVPWPHEHSEIYHKDKAEQATQKVVNEFRRYLADLEGNSETANPEDLLTALSNVEDMIDSLKVR